jgi:hypothetical protein
VRDEGRNSYRSSVGELKEETTGQYNIAVKCIIEKWVAEFNCIDIAQDMIQCQASLIMEVNR